MSNVMQDNAATKKPQFVHTFQHINVTGTDGTLNVAADTNVAVTQKPMPAAGSVWGIGMALSGTIATGTLTLYPTINGATLTNLAVQLGLPGEQYDSTKVEGRVYKFARGDRLGVVFVADTVSPDNNRDIVADVYVLLEDIEL